MNSENKNEQPQIPNTEQTQESEKGYSVFSQPQPIIQEIEEKQKQSTTNKNNPFVSIIQICLLAIVTFLFFQHSLHYPVAYETQQNINPAMLKSMLGEFKSIINLFTTNSITYLSYIANYYATGSEPNNFRLVNLIIHILNVLLLFHLIKTLLVYLCQQNEEEKSQLSLASWISFIITFLFALHPYASYATVYIIQRSLLLGTLFALLSLNTFIYGLYKRNAALFVFSTIFYFLSIYSSGRFFLLPLITIFLTLVVENKETKFIPNLLIQLVLYLPISIQYLFINRKLLSLMHEPWVHNLAVKINPKLAEHFFASNSDFYSYHMSLLKQAALFIKYLFLSYIPDTSMMAIHVPVKMPDTWFSFPEFGGLILFCIYPIPAIYLLTTKGIKKLIGFALLAPWILFLSELTITHTDEIFMVARGYIFIPFVSIIFAGLLLLIKHKIKWFVIAGYILLLTVVAFNRANTFQSPITLWQDAADKVSSSQYTSPTAHRPFFYLGNNLLEENQPEAAIQAYEDALKIAPMLTPAYYNLGAVYYQLNRYPEAIVSFMKAASLSPTNYQIYFNLGNVFLAQNKYKAAIKQYETSIKLRSIHLESHHNMAVALLGAGEIEKAIHKLERIIKIQPTYASAYYYLGNALRTQKQFEDAMKNYQKATELDPQNMVAFQNLALTELDLNMIEEAIQHIQNALTLDPDDETNAKILKSILDRKKELSRKDQQDQKPTR